MSATTAHDLTAFLGTVKESVDRYNSQRTELVQSLEQIIENAQQLLTQLGEQVGGTRRPRRIMKKAHETGGRRRGPGRPKGSGKKRGRPKGFKMSEEARAKMREAAKRRWADKRAGGGKKK